MLGFTLRRLFEVIWDANDLKLMNIAFKYVVNPKIMGLGCTTIHVMTFLVSCCDSHGPRRPNQPKLESIFSPKITFTPKPYFHNPKFSFP